MSKTSLASKFAGLMNGSAFLAGKKAAETVAEKLALKPAALRDQVAES